MPSKTAVTANDPDISQDRHGILLNLVLTTLIGLAALALCLGLSGFTGTAIISLCVFHLSLRPRPCEILTTLVPALLYWAAYIYFFNIPLSLRPSPAFLLETLGVGSLVVLSTRAVWSVGEEKQRILSVLFPAIGLLVFLAAKQRLLNVAALQGPTYDLNLFVVDGSLGFYVFQVARAFFRTHAVASECIIAVYGGLPVAMAIVYAAHLRKYKRDYHLLQVLVLAGVLGWVLYNLLPAAGPAYLLGPDVLRPLPTYNQLRLLPLQKIAMPPSVLRNAIPSLHMTWALLLVWNTQKLSRHIHFFASVFAILTAIATLATGEHYLVDLVVAYPFSLLAQSVCLWRLKNDSIRTASVCVGAFLTLGWMLIVRQNPRILLESRMLPWAAILLTLGLTYILIRKLGNAANSVSWEDEQLAIHIQEAIGVPQLAPPS